MMKTWLMRRGVRNPPSRCKTNFISVSVCRLPFINAWAWLARHNSVQRAAASSSESTSRMSSARISTPISSAILRTSVSGPTYLGRMSPAVAASIAPSRETLLHGQQTATEIGSRAWPLRISDAKRSREDEPRLFPDRAPCEASLTVFPLIIVLKDTPRRCERGHNRVSIRLMRDSESVVAMNQELAAQRQQPEQQGKSQRAVRNPIAEQRSRDRPEDAAGDEP